MPDKVKLAIDGKEIEVEKGTTVLQAAETLGLDVPSYCYHPGLSIAGNCRICLVEIEKFPKLATSCTTHAAEGMVVRTGGEKVEAGRRGVMEFLLANHPLDCPICDQAGECRLQEFSFEHGQGGARFLEEKIKGIKKQPIGPHVVLDTERCIVCTRCIRFCDEVSKTGELGVFQRGVFSHIGLFPGRELDNPYSGNTVDICPVGALTLREFRFQKRVWALKDVPSVCGACARGCNVFLGTSENRIWRMTPRENRDVNKWWMCDEGRLSFEEIYRGPRVRTALVRGGEGSGEVPWPRALDALAARLRSAKSVAGIASASLTLEDLYLLKRLFGEVLASSDLIIPEWLRGSDDEILIRADKTPNTAGARMLGLTVDEGGRRLKTILESARSGKLDVLLVLGDGLPPDVMAGLEEARGKVFTAAFSAFSGGVAGTADIVIPAAAYGEFEGTWINFQKRAQWVRRALTPPGVALEAWFAFAELMRRLEHDTSFESSADVLNEIAGKVADLEPLAGARKKALGDHGVPL